MSMDHYTPLQKRIRQLEDEQGQDANVVAISLHTAHDLQGMNIPAWKAAGFEDERANELVSGFSDGHEYAEKMLTPLGRVKVLTFNENRWGDDAVRIWEGNPHAEPVYANMTRIRVAFPNSEPFVGYVIATKWDAPEGRWLYKISRSESDQNDDALDNWTISDWLSLCAQ